MHNSNIKSDRCAKKQRKKRVILCRQNKRIEKEDIQLYKKIAIHLTINI